MQRLTKLNYKAEFQVNGIFEQKTESALKVLQFYNNLLPNGRADSSVYKALGLEK